MNLKQSVLTAGLVTTANSKMPGSSYPTNPFACKRGAVLAKLEGSVCSHCYARRLAIYRDSVAGGWARNQDRIDHAPVTDWVASMVYQIHYAHEKTGEAYNRWFDAGDLASTANLDRIAAVCRKTPTIKHWLSTREIGIVRAWLAAGNTIPRNLVIRLSAAMVDGLPPARFARGIATSTVHKHERPIGHACPAKTQGNRCGSCRKCWDRRTANVSYPQH